MNEYFIITPFLFQLPIIYYSSNKLRQRSAMTLVKLLFNTL